MFQSHSVSISTLLEFGAVFVPKDMVYMVFEPKFIASF